MIVLYRHTILRAALALVLACTGLATAPARASAATADAFEADNTWQTARDVGAIVGVSGDTGYYGEPMGVQARTFHFVDDATATSDEDWVRFTVSATDIDTGLSYIFEAFPSSSAVRPVIEIYGPGSANPTAPGNLPASSAEPTLTAIDPNAIQPGQALAYNGRWSGDVAASVSFIPAAAGTYYVRVRPYYQHESGIDPGFGGGVGSYQLRMKAGQLSRLSGADRIATAVAVSRERYPATGPDSKACIIASGFAFPDALAGSTLAGAVDGPLLLTARDSLPSAVTAELRRLGITQVYLLGGTAAVTDRVKTSIEALGISVKRVSGATRMATARQIALEAARHTTPARLAFVVNALNFPDALAASPMATHNVAPILLTGSATLDAQAEAALKDSALGITDVVIIGGTS
ncbi:MAG: cell wall-binding repeat-containing protein, partial [Coriobacteriia bacterium]|nr:cell wall-binding repeat-containing protein [Coriobacteriia bacterium]